VEQVAAPEALAADAPATEYVLFAAPGPALVSGGGRASSWRPRPPGRPVRSCIEAVQSRTAAEFCPRLPSAASPEPSRLGDGDRLRRPPARSTSIPSTPALLLSFWERPASIRAPSLHRLPRAGPARVRWLPPLGFQNTYAVAAPGDRRADLDAPHLRTPAATRFRRSRRPSAAPTASGSPALRAALRRQRRCSRRSYQALAEGR
jgi:hypothetical protein